MKFFTLTAVFLCLSMSAPAQQAFTISYDSTYRSVITYSKKDANKSHTRSTSYLTITPDANFPDRQISVKFNIPSSINIDEIKSIVFYCRTNDWSPFSKAIFFSKKAVNTTSRTIEFQVGGFQPNTHFTGYFFINSTRGEYICNNIFTEEFNFDTQKEKKVQSKLLFIIDKDLENNDAIDAALTNYMNTVFLYYPHITFEKTYIEDDINKKNELYEQIKLKYANVSNPLRYLFFIGSNAGVRLRRRIFDFDNNVMIGESLSSISFYTQIFNPVYTFNSTIGLFDSKTYAYCNFPGLPVNDIGDEVSQSNSSEIAFGGIFPNGSTPKITAILNYFQKLDKFKKGLISFNKSVLFSDTYFYDGHLPDSLASINPRWQQNDTINVAQKHGPYYHDTDHDWYLDYKNKISTKSYEVLTYLGHGTPTFHYFSFNSLEVEYLPAFNSMSLLFLSCSIGKFTEYNYLANKYLEKGNTLSVLAYTEPVGISAIGQQSGLINFFAPNELYDDISKGMFYGDAYLFNSSFLEIQINLGDPLLTIDPPCMLSSAIFNSPKDDFHDIKNLYAKEDINATNKILTGANIIYGASKKITLNPGFKVENGGIFLTKIMGCQN